MIRNASAPYNSSGGAASSHGPFDLTIGDGVGRRVSIGIARESATATISTVTFNGVAIVGNLRNPVQHSVQTALNIAFYDYEVPDELAEGTYQWSFTTGASTSNVSAYAVEMTNRATGAPEAVGSNQEGPAVGTDISATLNVSEGADVFAVLLHSAGAPSLSFIAGVSLGDLQNETSYTSASGEGSGVAEQTPLTVTGRASVSDSGYAKLLAVVSYAQGGTGPTFTTQPTDQVAVAGVASDELKTLAIPYAYTLAGEFVGASVEVDTGSGFVPLTISGIFSLTDAGAGSGVFGIASPGIERHGHVYRIVVEDSTGVSTSDPFTLTVYAGATYDGDLSTDESGVAAGTVVSDVPCASLAVSHGIAGVYVELPAVTAGVTLRGGGTSAVAPSVSESTVTVDPNPFATADAAEVTIALADSEAALIPNLAFTVAPRIAQVSRALSFVSVEEPFHPADGATPNAVTVELFTTELNGGDRVPAVGFPAARIVVKLNGSTTGVTQPTGVSTAAGVLTASVVTSVTGENVVTAEVDDSALDDTATFEGDGEAPPGPSPGVPDFRDEFTGPARNPADGFSYPTAASVTPVTVEGEDCLRFRGGPDADLEDSRPEQPFVWPQNVTEVWIRHRIKYPLNYIHRNQTTGATNNKFIRVYGDDYGATNKVGASTWYNASDTRGAFRWDRTTTSGLGPSAPSGGGETSPTVIFPIVRGQWHDVELHYKMESGPGENDQLSELRIDGELISSWQNQNQVYDSVRPYWNRGYLQGHQNAGHAEETDILIDDLEFWFTDPNA